MVWTCISYRTADETAGGRWKTSGLIVLVLYASCEIPGMLLLVHNEDHMLVWTCMRHSIDERMVPHQTVPQRRHNKFTGDEPRGQQRGGMQRGMPRGKAMEAQMEEQMQGLWRTQHEYLSILYIVYHHICISWRTQH